MNPNNLQSLQAMLAQAQAQTSKPLMEFKAGICTLQGTTVTADKRRGRVVVKHGDDGLLHLQWVLRPSNTKELDIALFPRGPKWEPVPECKDGRVFLLRFPQTNRKQFFWMQEPSDEKDEDRTEQMNEFIQNPPPNPSRATDQAFRGSSLMSMMGGQGGMSGASGASSSTSSSAAAPAPAPAAAAAAARAPVMPHVPSSLASVLDAGRTVPVIDALLSDEKDAKELDALLEYLPQSLQTRDEIKASLRSPQLQQTLKRFNAILSSEQFGSVMQSFGLRISGGLGVDAFIEAINQQASEEKESE